MRLLRHIFACGLTHGADDDSQQGELDELNFSADVMRGYSRLEPPSESDAPSGSTSTATLWQVAKPSPKHRNPHLKLTESS